MSSHVYIPTLSGNFVTNSQLQDELANYYNKTISNLIFPTKTNALITNETVVSLTGSYGAFTTLNGSICTLNNISSTNANITNLTFTNSTGTLIIQQSYTGLDADIDYVSFVSSTGTTASITNIKCNNITGVDATFNNLTLAGPLNLTNISVTNLTGTNIRVDNLKSKSTDTIFINDSNLELIDASSGKLLSLYRFKGFTVSSNVSECTIPYIVDDTPANQSGFSWNNITITPIQCAVIITPTTSGGIDGTLSKPNFIGGTNPQNGLYQSSSTQYSYFQSYPFFSPGLYQFQISLGIGLDRGIMSLYIEDILILTYDTYSAIYDYFTFTSNVTIGGNYGPARLTLRADSKNASSYGYFLAWNALSFIRIV